MKLYVIYINNRKENKKDILINRKGKLYIYNNRKKAVKRLRKMPKNGLRSTKLNLRVGTINFDGIEDYDYETIYSRT